MIHVRDETAADHAAVRRVVTEAFSTSELGHHGEAELVEVLRASGARLLALVAEIDHANDTAAGRDVRGADSSRDVSAGEIIGHALVSPLVVRTAEREFDGMALAPMAVARAHQRAGVGSALVNSALARLDREACPVVAVLGHPDYYPRFGFELAANYGVRHGFEGIPQDVFFLRAPDPALRAELDGGVAFYTAEFGEQR